MNDGFQSEVLIRINLFYKGRIFKSISTVAAKAAKMLFIKKHFFSGSFKLNLYNLFQVALKFVQGGQFSRS